MFKVTPNPPETDPASPYESIDSRKLHEAAERALDHYLNPTTPTYPTHDPMYFANPAYTTESLLADASENLGSASAMLDHFATLLDTPHRKLAQGIAQLVMLGELAVNQALDNVEPKL
ncbi:DUF6124 family protein [Pseudomonas sp. NPDC089534]|uniref:DUF6124 family protein n=1 Tax=Pseudomonas sp. NPDC089534 TaxID=3364468 RepID=UPI00382D4198